MATGDTDNKRSTDTFPFERLPVEFKKEVIEYAIPQGLSLAYWNYTPYPFIFAEHISSAASYVNISEETPDSSLHVRDQLSTYTALLRVKVVSAEAKGT